MTLRKNHRKANGHAGPRGRTNGNAPASTERGGVPAQRDQAASEGTRRASVGKDASSATAHGTDRKAYAEAAPPHSGKENGDMKTKDQQNGQPKDQKDATLKKFLLAGPTDFAAMQDGAAYVNSVASRVDLVGASVRLVCADDEKVAKAELDRLREMKFGKAGAAVAEEPPRLDFGDLPRPAR